MFTFGREHEKKCAAGYFRKPADPAMLLALIDAVHDLLEGKGSTADVEHRIVACFTEGGLRTWEGAGYWLGKTQTDYSELAGIWMRLAMHPKAEIRSRVACFMDDMPEDVLAVVAPILLADKSRRVAETARRAMPAIPSPRTTRRHSD